MKHEIKNKPDYASLHVVLDTGEQVITESGAMMGMSTGLEMKSNMQGGLMAAAKRAIGGESIFLNTYTATADSQRLDVAPIAQEAVQEHNRGLAVAGAAACVRVSEHVRC